MTDTTIEFQPYPKTPRLSQIMSDIVVTEKIDGTNASVKIENGELVYVGSRNRIIKVGDDNYGFAAFVEKNKEAILKLGNGIHYGEWFGEGIQNNPLKIVGKRFALFNTFRPVESLPEGIEQVPVLYKGSYSAEAIQNVIDNLAKGSHVKGAGDGNKPEGIIVYFNGIRKVAKWTFENQDGKWKVE